MNIRSYQLAIIYAMLKTRRFISFISSAIFIVILLNIWSKLYSRNILTLRDPVPISKYPLFPPPSRLLDLENFKYIANPAICLPNESVLGLILVHTHPSHRDLREVTRKHLPHEILEEIGIRRVFLIGEATKDQKKYPAVKQEVIANENAKYRDLVQRNFVEHYRNLTYKQVMGLTWATRFCPQAEFIIKVDDDIAVDIFQIRQLIKYKYRNIENQMLGLIQIDSHPKRTKQSKWQVTKEEFSGNIYPPFLSGWCYIAPMKSIRKIVSAAHAFPYFWIDDVLLTGIIPEKLNIDREGLNNKYTIHTAHMRCCTQDAHSSLYYYCDYFAGPTEGDEVLMAKSLDQFRNCYMKGCKSRKGKQTIAKTCVETSKDLPSGKGVGEIIPLL